MEKKFLLKCTRCFSNYEDMMITHIDGEGNLFCKRCITYMKKVGGYDLKPFNIEDFLKSS